MLSQGRGVIVVSDVTCKDPRSRSHSLGGIKRTIPRSRPASGRAPRAGLVQDAARGTGAQRRLVLDETEHGAMLVQVGPPEPSETAPPNGVLPVIPGDGKELVEIGAGNCHSDAMRVSVPVSPDRPTKIVLRRSLESAVFTQVYVMTLGSQAAPGQAVRVLVYDIYQNAFQYFRMGYASAEAVTLTLIVLGFTLIQFRAFREQETS